MSDMKVTQKQSEKVKCTICDKELVRGSLKRHKETKHGNYEAPKKMGDAKKKEDTKKKQDVKKKEDAKKKEDDKKRNVKHLEKINDASKVKLTDEELDEADFYDCIDDHIEEGEIVELGKAEYERIQPLVSSSELESYLPQDDSLLADFLALEQVVEERQFGDMFSSNFAEDMRRHSLDQQQRKKCNECEATNAKFEKQRKQMLKQDESVRAADMALKGAENSKIYLRRQLKKKENDIDEISLKWQEEAEAYSEEITRLSMELKLKTDMVKVLKAERENSTDVPPTDKEVSKKKPTDKPTDKEDSKKKPNDDKATKKSKDVEVVVVVDQCQNCEFVTSDKNKLKRHVQKVHQIYDCLLCPTMSNSSKEYNLHRDTHLEEMSMCYTCSKCNKRFKFKVEMIAHMVNPCRDMDARNVTKSSNTVKATQETIKHVKDTCTKCDKCKCVKCKVTFKGKESNDQHIPTDHIQLCRNGPSCQFLSQNRCLYFHPEAAQPDGGQWQEVGPRRPRQKQSEQQGHGKLPRVPEGDALWCSYEDKCRKARTCKFKHPAVQRRMGNLIAHDMDFPPHTTQRRK